jgi:AAA domain
MAKPLLDVHPSGAVTLSVGKGLIFRRDPFEEVWHEGEWNGSKYLFAGRVPRKFQRLLDRTAENPDAHRRLQRFPRLAGFPDHINEFSEIPSLDEYKDALVTWTVAGLFPRASLILLVAPPDAYKTWFVLELAKAVSQGTGFLGHKTIRMPVLCLDLDNPVAAVVDRRKILKFDDSALLKVWGGWVKDPPALIGDPRLENWATSLQPLMIFDSFLRFHSADENSAKDMAGVLKQLRNLAVRRATVMLVHHPAKSKDSDYRGSTDVLAAVDAAFKITKKKTKQETVLTLSCFKHRFIKEPGVICKFVLRDGALQIIENSTTDDDSSGLTQKIKEAIASNPGITQKEIMSRLSLAETSGRKILKEGLEVHWITVRGIGKTLRYFPKP